jgi:hypothetical protein
MGERVITSIAVIQERLVHTNWLLTFFIIIIIIIILTANGVLPGGSGYTIRHNTQNNTTIKRNTAQNYTHNKGHTTQIEYKQSQLQTISCDMYKDTIGNSDYIAWKKEAVVAYLEALFRHSYRTTKGNPEKRQDSRCSVRGSKRAPPRYSFSRLSSARILVTWV